MNTETIAASEVGLNTSDLLDEKTFREIFLTNYAPLCAYSQIKYGLDAESAKDAVNTSFLKLWEARHKISLGPNLKAYIYRVVSNTCLDMLKRSKVISKRQKEISAYFNESIFDNGFDNADMKQLSAEFDAALNELPAQMRRVFILCRHQGLKYAEVASSLGISMKTVETHMSKAMARLRLRLLKYITFLPIWAIACYYF